MIFNRRDPCAAGAPALLTDARITAQMGAIVNGAPRGAGRRASEPGFIVMIGGLLVFVTALIGVAINMAGFLDTVYMDLTLTLPKFDYGIVDGREVGNETFGAFVQMRYVGGGVLGAALLYAGVIRVMEDDSIGIVQRGVSNRIIAHSLTFVVLFMAFPILWDAGAEIMEDLATWVLNPLYSFDPDAPCPAGWYGDASTILEEYNGSEYRTGGATSDVATAEAVCQPGFKVRYVFEQMMGHTEIEHIRDEFGGDGLELGDLTVAIESFASELFVNVFLGLTKGLVTINVLISAFVIGIMADVLIGMLIAALPLFLFLTLIPRAKGVADRFVDALPALFLLPVLSATVIVVGAGFLADITVEGDDDASGLLYKWVASLGVVFLAVSLPVMLVGMLGSVTSMATSTVQSGVQASAMVTGMGAAGALQGLQRGAAAGESLSALGRAGTMAGAGLAGFGHGVAGAAPGAIRGSGFGGSDMGSGMAGIGSAAEKEFSDAGGIADLTGGLLRGRIAGRRGGGGESILKSSLDYWSGAGEPDGGMRKAGAATPSKPDSAGAGAAPAEPEGAEKVSADPGAEQLTEAAKAAVEDEGGTA